MNPIERINHNLENFTNKERKIADYVLNNPIETIQVNATVLSKNAKTSKSAFVRMCQKIGYNGYSEFRFALSNYLVSNKESSSQEENSSIQSILNTYVEYIKLMEQNVSSDDIKDISSLIFNARRIKIFGINRTGLSSRQLRLRLSKLGQDSEAIVDPILMEEVVNSLNKDDLVIIFSITGEKYNHLVEELRDNQTDIILITMNHNAPISNQVSLEIVLPMVSRGTSRFLDDQALFFIFIELILNSLADTSPILKDIN